MQITVIKKNELSVFTLPNNDQEAGSNYFWITDYEVGKLINLVSAEFHDGRWTLISNQNAYIIDKDNRVISEVILNEYSFYTLKNTYKNEMYYLYVSPVYENTFMETLITQGSVLKFGSGESNEIIYPVSSIPKEAFVIEITEQGFHLRVSDINAAVYVNHLRVATDKYITYGDIVFLFGLKVIPMRRDGKDYLLINNPGNLLKFKVSLTHVVLEKSEFSDSNETLNEDTYNVPDTFYRTPHFYKTVTTYTLNIDAPPQKRNDQGNPLILTIGPMITMSMVSIIMLISTVNSVRTGERDLSSSITSMVMAVAMLASCLLWPMLTNMYRKKQEKKYEAKRQAAYQKYIEKMEAQIRKELEIQRIVLIDNYFSIKKCQEIIKSRNAQLWQRRITDEDFLSIPVGIGDKPMSIEIRYPEEKFSIEEDNLLDMVHKLGQRKRTLNDVPITYSFYDNKVTGIVGEESTAKALLDRIVLQIMTNYSYDEVKLVTFTSIGRENAWDYIKTTPHSWANDRSMRFFGASNDDYREIVYYLDKIFQERVNSKQTSEKHMPHYVIITDSIKSIDNYNFIKKVMTTKENLGFSIIMLVNRISSLPNECKNFMEVSRQECNIFQSELNSEVQKFQIDFSSIDHIYDCAKELANIPLDIKTEAEASLVDIFQFLEMYQVGNVNQLNSWERWKKNNPVLTLQAPVGIGRNGELITLDLHEKYHGPHGLIAGTTGSGKSEFIISFVLSLAVNYHPYEVQVILIDYKGGSLAGAFINDKFQLPHLAGTITNLDGNELNRSLASIESEVKRRQRVFNEARIVSNESTIDIYKYQKLWREGKLKDMDPIAHLFIISDEFAELKEQQPEFMDKLISVARVGRSLGIHLILATQKPGGVVDSQIWSNTRFRVCLKVQDTADSQEVLKKPDAAYLKRTGRFYLQVGYDEVYTIGQSAWAGGQYYPSTTFKKEVDTSINTINNIAYITITKESEVKEDLKSCGEELPNIVEYLSNVASKHHIQIKKLWLDKIPSKIFVDSLKSKYHFERVLFELNPVIGEYDDPSTQNQYLLTVPFSQNGNAIVYGIAGSGKEQFISSLIYSCMITYAPEEVNFYIMDFGAETMRMFKNSPYVGDIVYLNDSDKVTNLFKMLDEELNYRKQLFASYGGSFASYIKKGKYLANYVVILNNFEAFSENYEDFVDILNQYSREAFKYGIFFLVTASNENAVRIRTKQNFSLIYALEQNDESDFSAILGNCRGKMPAKIKGRGLFKKNSIYEFQTASIVKDNEDLNMYVSKYCDAIYEKTKYRAKRIPILPEVVDYEYVKNEIDYSYNMVVGVNKDTLHIEKYNLKKDPINFVCSYEIVDTISFIKAFSLECMDIPTTDFLFLNSTEYDFSDMPYQNRIYDKKFDIVFEQLASYIDNVFKIYQEADYNEEVLKRQKGIICFVFGVYDVINKLRDETKQKITEMMKQDTQMNLVTFVFVENPDLLRNFLYDEWFKTASDTSRGIWVGNGVADQSFLKISKIRREDREDISNEYGFVVNTSKIYRIKLLADYHKDS